MKKFVIMLVGLVATISVGCDPMDEIYEDIDTSLKVEGAVDITLSEDDYKALKLDEQSFNTVDDAKALIPGLLSSKYPAFTKNSLANVTFNLFSPVTVESYTVLESDYQGDEKYFQGLGDIQDFLSDKYSQAAEGDFVELTYQVLADEIAYNIDEDDFDLIGEELASKYPAPASNAAQYSNFDRREGRSGYWSEAMILEAINVVLTDNFDNVTGQKYNVSYAIYNGSAGTESMTVQYNGNAYISVGGVAYEFASTDYDLVGTQLAATYPGPAGNVAQYGSFDVRETSDNYWSPSMLLEAFNIVLDAQFPDSVDGDKYELTYKIYNGGVTTTLASVIKENGAFIIDENASVSTIETTVVYAYTNGEWNEPLALETADYTAMGQRYPNFDDQDEAAYKIGIFLDNKFPYAEEGDFVAVAYAFYSGSTSTRYSNFVFENGGFKFIPDVIESSLQFGFDGTTWVPDNTIQYTFSKEDYALVATKLATEYPSQAGNLDNYGNFNRGGGSTSWDDTMMLDAFRVVLNNIDPNAEDGQKYQLSYTIYAGGYSTQTSSVIKVEGTWEYQE